VRATTEPRCWKAVGIAGAVLGLALWAAAIIVAWHFVENYW
jgi:hypothetical protein